MTKAEKADAIKSLTATLTDNKVIYLADISGLNASQTSKLRRACFKSGIKLSVVKNTLLAKAMNSVEQDFEALTEVLTGNTSLLLSETGNAPAKVIKEFRKTSNKPILKGALVEECIYVGDDQLDALVNIKSKEELIGEVISLLQSPATNVISALQSGKNKLSGIIKTLSERAS